MGRFGLRRRGLIRLGRVGMDGDERGGCLGLRVVI